MLDYLQTIFGTGMKSVPYSFPPNAPFYINDGYTVQKLTWNNNECLAVKPHDTSLRLPSLKKQLKIISSLCNMNCALNLDNLTAAQRQNLLESNTPFISIPQQVYLPFWGCAFSGRFKREIAVDDKMAPMTQLVFLYLYYQYKNNPQVQINLTQIAKALNIAKSSCTRAIDDLTTSGIFTQRTVGTNKWLSPASSLDEILQKAMLRMSSPVGKKIYVKSLPDNVAYKYSGLQALSKLTMVGANASDGGLVISKKDVKVISIDSIITKQKFEDSGGHLIEVWNYDPKALSESEIVDDISLLLSLRTEPDERIQGGLDTIRKKYGLPTEG